MRLTMVLLSNNTRISASLLALDSHTLRKMNTPPTLWYEFQILPVECAGDDP